MKVKIFVRIAGLFSFLLFPILLSAYPIDGYPYTGIKRLLYQYKVYQDSTKDSRLSEGALLMMDSIQLSLKGINTGFPKNDQKLESKLDQIFRYLEPEYSMSVMDITDENNLIYAGRKELTGYQPGSVGKIAIAIGLFNELHRTYGDDWTEIVGVLRNPRVLGGPWVHADHHTIPLYDIKNDKYSNRKAQTDDIFSLYEWLDHMFNKSSNAAASVLWREAMLLHIYGKNYECLSQEEAVEFFEITPKAVLSDIAIDILHCPLFEMGISDNEWRLGSFFTSNADRIVPGKGGSQGTTKGLMRFLFKLEKGDFIDDRYSLELKRLMYLTDRRIRYAASHILDDAAVYFKSGSLYSFKDEPGFSRKPYAGNRYNYMNSVAIVEQQKAPFKKYIVVLMSNVLRKNSVGEHYALAGRIDDLMSEL